MNKRFPRPKKRGGKSSKFTHAQKRASKRQAKESEVRCPCSVNLRSEDQNWTTDPEVLVQGNPNFHVAFLIIEHLVLV